MKTNFSATEENSKSHYTLTRLRTICSLTGHSSDTVIKAMVIPAAIVIVAILLLVSVMAMLIYKYLQFKNCCEPVQSYHLLLINCTCLTLFQMANNQQLHRIHTRKGKWL